MSYRQKEPLTYIGRTNWRNTNRLFGIKSADRRAHMYIVGKTGTGKSSLLQTLVQQDVEHGQGLALLDPHGDLVDRLVPALPEARRREVIYFNVPDPSRPLGFNPLAGIPAEKRPLAVGGILDAFKKIWSDSWGVRLEHVLRNALFALLDETEATLADILRLFDEDAFRRRVASQVTNPQVQRFWLKEYPGYSPGMRKEAIAPIQNKVGAFLADPRLRAILTQSRSAFDLRAVMDHGGILLVNLAKGKLGEDASALMGALLVSQIGFTGLCRADVREEDRRDFYLYVDEFQTFSTLSFANMLSELRKYRVSLILAHQYLAQLEPEVRDAILGNVGTMISFRVGPADARVLEKEFFDEVEWVELIGLPNYQIYVRLMVDGTVARPFTGTTLKN